MAIKMRMPVRVTGVTLNKNSINLTTVGDTEQLTATISPNNAEDTAVTWSSSDTSIATVSDTGLVTCVTPGTATITVTTHDGGYTATCGVSNVTNPIPTDGLLAYYPMDEDWNDHKADLGVTGTTYNCSPINGTFTYSFTTGKVGNCINRQNQNSSVLDTGISLGSDYTIMMWLKVPTWTGWWIGFSTKNSDSGDGMSAQWNFNETDNIGIKVKSSHYWYQNYTYVADTWVHFGVSKSGGTYKIYVNGTPQTFSANSNVGARTLTLLGIGAGGSGDGFPEYNDEVCIYNRALTDQEISDYYTATA